MKRFLLIGAALALPGCAALPAISAISTITDAVAVGSDKVMVPATKGLIIAHNAYQGAAALATAAINAGLVPTNRLPQIGALSDLAKSKLDQADRGQNVAENVADVMNIISTMKSLSGR